MVVDYRGVGRSWHALAGCNYVLGSPALPGFFIPGTHEKYTTKEVGMKMKKPEG